MLFLFIGVAQLSSDLYEIFTVATIENRTGISSTTGQINNNFLRLILDRQLTVNVNYNIGNVRFIRGSTSTIVRADASNIPTNYTQKRLDATGAVRIPNKPAGESYELLDVLFYGSLLSLLRNNNQPLGVIRFGTDTVNGFSFIDLQISYDLSNTSTEQQKYLEDTGRVIIGLEPVQTSVQEVSIAGNLTPLYQESLYAVIESLDLAWSKSEVLGYRGQMKILNDMFTYLDYDDGTSGGFLSAEENAEIAASLEEDDLDFIIENSTRINPYKVKGFTDFLTELSINRTEIQSTTTSVTLDITQGYNLQIISETRPQNPNGLTTVRFTTKDLALLVGQRVRVNTLNLAQFFELVVQNNSQLIKEGFVIFPTEVNPFVDFPTLVGTYLVGELNVNDTIKRALQINRLPFTREPEQYVLDMVKNVVVRRPSALLQDLEQPITEEFSPNESLIGELVPPGIGNSSRSNGDIGIPANFQHSREIQRPYPVNNYCTRFSTNTNCASQINISNLNYRSDALNRNPRAIVEVLRYPNELPLGVISATPAVTILNTVDDVYRNYWETFENGEAAFNGDCLYFRAIGQPELVTPCYAVRRCSRRKYTERSRLLQCVEQTVPGLALT